VTPKTRSIGSGDGFGGPKFCGREGGREGEKEREREKKRV